MKGKDYSDLSLKNSEYSGIKRCRGRPANDYASLLVAEKFHKSHCKELRDIDKLPCSQEFRVLYFEDTTYIDKQNKEHRMYEMTRDGLINAVSDIRQKLECIVR